MATSEVPVAAWGRADSDEIWTRFPDAFRASWSQGALGELSPTATTYLLSDAREIELPLGPLPPARADRDTILLFIVDGLVRSFRTGRTRQVTTRYAAECDFVGIPSSIRHGSSAHGEVLVPVHAIRMAPCRLRELVRRDAAAAWIVMKELARLHDAAVDMACDNVFLSVRQRVARHLLDLAVRDADGLTVSRGHQDVADAIGSVREVVSRVLRELRSEELISRSGDRIVLLRPAELHRISAARGAGADDEREAAAQG